MTDDYDHRFFRAIAVGAVIGVLGLWAVLTVVFYFLTDQTITTTAGFALLPAVFCGPFFGGLITTAATGPDAEATEVVTLPSSDARSEANAA